MSDNNSSTSLFTDPDLEAAERVAASLRRRAKSLLHEPTRVIAERLGCLVVVDPEMERDAYVFDKTIWVRAGRPDRMNFSIGHELGEIHLPAAIRCEATCNRVAAALILPRRFFIGDMFRYRLELPALKERWPGASFSLLARRLVDLCPGSAVAKWMDSDLVWRKARRTEELTSAELEAVERIRQPACGRAEVARDGVLALAWKLHPRGAKFRGISLAVEW